MSFAPLDAGRVELHRLEEADAEAVAKLAGDWDVARYTARLPHPFSRAAAAAWVGQARDGMAAGTGFVFACRRRGDDALIGCAGLSIEPRGGEIGYWIAKAHWGQGYGSDAARRLVALAFDTLGLARVRAAIWVGDRRWNLRLDNGIDIRLPEKDPQAAWAWLVALERDRQLLSHGIIAIDLRIPSRLVVQRRDQGDRT